MISILYFGKLVYRSYNGI